MDSGAWWAAVHGVTKSQILLSDFTFHFHALEREMATHSSVLAWRIPGTGEPGGLQSMGSLRVRYDWVTSLFTFHVHALAREMATHSGVLAWRIPGIGEPGGLPSMGSHRSDMTEATQQQQWWPYMHDSKRDTDVKNRLLDSVGEGEGGMIWENSIETCTLSYVK